MLLNFTWLKHYKNPLLLIALSLILYWFFAYDLVRTQGIKLLVLYSLLFVLAYYLIKTAGFNFKIMVVAAIVFRLVFVLALPNLSQDFYRFIWDGRLLLEGFNPYLYTPESFISQHNYPIAQAQELYNDMGKLNASHFSNYPPLNQLCFVIAALFSSKNILGSVVVMRVIIIAADIGTLYFGKKLLEAVKLPSTRVFWYILNPLIIIELTGNLHFEGVMIFFLIFGLYLLQSGKWQWAAVVFACSILVKLIPLMFLPLFFGWFNVKKTCEVFSKEKWIPASTGMTKLIAFYGVIGLVTLLFFLPFYSSEFVSNYSKTVGLWFGSFEFNASVYYVLRAIGYTITGYNTIAIIGKILPLITLIIILYFSFFGKNNTMPKLMTSMVLVFSCYLFLSTTVHPWYLSTLVILCVFTPYKYPLVWSFVIVLSYLSYLTVGTMAKSENLWLIGLEYAIVFSVFIWEVFLNRKEVV